MIWKTAILMVALGAGQALACDAKQVEKVQHALSHASDAQLPTIALAGLAQACPEPEALAKAARDVAFAPPDMRPMLMAKAVTQVPMLWRRACKSGLRAFETLAVVAPSERAGLLHKQCGAARLGYSVEDLGRKGGSPLFALLYAQVLEEAKVAEAPKRALTAALVGRRPLK